MEVNCFWDGPRLTLLEQMCLASFLHHGIGVNLYAYDPPHDVPAGVVLRDATDILPRDRLFRYAAGSFNVGSVAGFAIIFRYELLLKHGGWWTDTDVCCLQSWDLENAEIYFREAYF